MHRAWKPVEFRARSGRTATAALAIASLTCLLLAGVRLVHSLSLVTPLQLTTSGAEEESLASISRFLHGQAVYTDPRVIPFTASYFNWLFYTVYGTVAGRTLELLRLNETWLPTICRLITLAFAASGVAIFAHSVREATDGRVRRGAAILYGALAFFNPLCGFWVITTRPDVDAAVLELGAVAGFLRYCRTNRPLDLVVVALLLEAAWAFKQTSVGPLAGIALALLFLHGWLRHPEIVGYHPAWLLAVPFSAGSMGACAVLGPVYRHGLYLSQINSGFHPLWALLHFGDALLKMPFIAVALGGAVLAWQGSDRTLRAFTLIMAATFVVEFAASSKGGAGDYYFLSLGVMSVLWIALALDRFSSRTLTGAILVAAVWQAGAVVAVLAGHCGTLDPRDPARPYEHLAAYLAGRPGPVFVEDTYGDLPWISPASPHFVIAYNNQVDALAGVTFQDGGWEGLLARGYFATVVTKAGSHDPTDAALVHYHVVREETGWRYYERR